MKSSIPLTLCERSSNIVGYGYDTITNTLAIRFKTGTPGGNTYHYANVPAQLYADLCGAESKGKFFAAHIKMALDTDNNPLYPSTLMEREDDDDGDEPITVPSSPTPPDPAKIEETA